MTADLDFQADPIVFCEEDLGIALYEWQDRILACFKKSTGRFGAGERTKVSVVAPNGSGKDDRVIAGLAIWWLAVHKRGRVVITSKDSRQLDEQTYPAIAKHSGKLQGWTWLQRKIVSPTGGEIHLFTTDEATRAEGWHKSDDIEGPLLIVVNEAKSVPDAIFTAFDRCTFNGLLYISSAGLMQGRFYESQTKFAGQFQRQTVTVDDCPHIPKDRIEDLREMYGAEHPFFKSTFYSVFTSQDDANAFIFDLEKVNANLRHPPVAKRGDRSAFCDFAAGGDENVLAVRTGNRIEIAAAWRERDTMAAVGRFLQEFRKNGLQAHEIFADEGGLGKGMCDRLWEMGWEINRVNFGSKPYDPRYRHRGAEMWHTLASAVINGEVILPDDSQLVAQLTTRKVKIESDGRLGVVPKDQMRKDGLPSPDRADAVAGAWACHPADFTPKMGGWSTPFEELEDEFKNDHIRDGDMNGMETG